ncbi:hypothetical protein FKM82_007598 [Ascaphus truei]
MSVPKGRPRPDTIVRGSTTSVSVCVRICVRIIPTLVKPVAALSSVRAVRLRFLFFQRTYSRKRCSKFLFEIQMFGIDTVSWKFG